ncbi:MAG: exodeoxyribonuclease small subunit, partial [Actinomycetota bacterium]|nr:exodeoxyribonuclease small subunit [Actinomycetota bacterium]
MTMERRDAQGRTSPSTTGPDPADALASSATSESGSEVLSFEQARDELVAVVERLQQGQGTLEESLDLWERGERLAQICEQHLQAARLRIE